MHFRFFKHLLVLLMIGVLLPSCRENPGVVVRIEYEDLTSEQQAHLGYELMISIEQDTAQFSILDEDEYEPLYTYVNRLLSEIINTSLVENRTKFDWEILLVEDDERLTTFSTPGGKIFIYTGMLKFLRSEHELAALIAHEIYLIEQDAIPTGLIDEFTGDVVGRIMLGAQLPEEADIIEWLQTYTYSESDVEAADQFSVDLICPFQYAVTGMKEILIRAGDTSAEALWLQHRPGDLQQRIQRVGQQAAQCKEEGATYIQRYQFYIGQLP